MNLPLGVGRFFLNPVTYYTRGAMVIQGLLVLVALSWFQMWPPVPGVAIGFLGVAAVAMAVRAPYFKPAEEVIWIVIAFSLFTVEIRAIYRDRDEYATNQAQIRREENARLEKMLSQNQDHFDKTLGEMKGISKLSGGALKLSSKALQQITGGGQYCYLEAEPVGSGRIGFFVWNSGPLPLERCFVVIRENLTPKSAQDAVRQFQPIMVKELGPIAPGKNRGMGTDIVLPASSYYIQIHTRNDRFYETLTVHTDYPNGKKGEGFQSIKIRDDKGRLVYSYPEQH